MIRVLLVLLTATMPLLGCNKKDYMGESPITPDEYAIYSMMVEPHYPASFPAQRIPKVIYVRDSTVLPEDWKYFEGWPGDERQSAPKILVESIQKYNIAHGLPRNEIKMSVFDSLVKRIR